MKHSPMHMHDKAVLVTGADEPLGRAVAVLLSQLGAMVIVAAKDISSVLFTETMSLMEGQGHQIEEYPEKSEDLAGWLRHLVSCYGSLDGVCFIAESSETPQAEVDFSQVMQQQLYPAFELAKGLRHKKVRAESSGLVFLLSLEGLQGPAEEASFAASQGAIHSMTKALSLELAREKVRVNCLAVGPLSSDEGSQSLLGKGSPHDVAQAVAFLLADTGRWITGTTMVVDGGFTLASQGG